MGPNETATVGPNQVAKSRAGEEPDEVEGALEGGARVCGDEAEIRICEAALSRTAEECHPTVAVCALVNVYLARKQLLLLAPA